MTTNMKLKLSLAAHKSHINCSPRADEPDCWTREVDQNQVGMLSQVLALMLLSLSFACCANLADLVLDDDGVIFLYYEPSRTDIHLVFYRSQRRIFSLESDMYDYSAGLAP